MMLRLSNTNYVTKITYVRLLYELETNHFDL